MIDFHVEINYNNTVVNVFDIIMFHPDLKPNRNKLKQT